MHPAPGLRCKGYACCILQTDLTAWVKYAALRMFSYHPVHFVDCLTKSSRLEACRKHRLHNSIQLATLVEVIALDFRCFRELLGGNEDGLHMQLNTLFIFIALHAN